MAPHCVTQAITSEGLVQGPYVAEIGGVDQHLPHRRRQTPTLNQPRPFPTSIGKRRGTQAPRHRGTYTYTSQRYTISRKTTIALHVLSRKLVSEWKQRSSIKTILTLILLKPK